MNGQISMRVLALLLFFSLMILKSTATADEVVIDNGDRITGTITSVEGETVILETEYSDQIRIKKAKIKRIYTSNSVEIHLIGGEVLKGKMRSEEDGRISVEATPDRTETFVEWENVLKVNPPVIDSSRWKGNITAGAGHQSGNTDRIHASIGAEAERRTDRDRYGLRFLYQYAEEDKEVSARNVYGATKYDYFFTKKYYGYLSVELLNDEFKDLNLRTIVGPGVGYQIWDDAIKFLLVEGGISYFSEDLEEGKDNNWVTARLASNVRYKIKDAVIFSNQLVIYPSLEDTGEYQLRNEAAVTSLLGSGWSLKLSNILERDSNPPKSVKSNDWYWILGLQYGFY